MAPFICIALHRFSDALIAAGYLITNDRMPLGDTDLAAAAASIVGVVCGLVAELWYWAMRKLGRQTRPQSCRG